AEDTRTAPNADAWSADSAASAKRLQCVRFIGAFRPARDGQRFIAAMPISGSSRLSLNRTNSKSTRASKAAEHRRTARRWRVGYGGPKIRQVLECAAAAALWISHAVQGPNACAKSERVLSMNHSSQIRTTNHEIRRNTEIRMTKLPVSLLRIVQH